VTAGPRISEFERRWRSLGWGDTMRDVEFVRCSQIQVIADNRFSNDHNMSSHCVARPLDPAEAFFFMSDRISCMNFVFFAERSGHLDPARIRAALAVIQDENPLLRSRISWSADRGLCFEPASGTPIDLECREANANDWQTWLEYELAHPFAEGAAPLIRCLYLEMSSPEQSVLALVFHHAVADGRSGNELLRRLLDCIATHKGLRADGSTSPLPPMHQVFPPRFRWTEQPDAAKRAKEGLMTDYKRHGPLTPLPWLSSDISTRTPRFIRLSFPSDVTQRLLALSRQHGTSVHGAICAAQLLAQFRLQMGDEPATLLLSCPVDMRPLLEPAQPVAPTALCMSLISAAFVLDSSTDFWVLARDVIAQTRKQLARGEGHIFFTMYGLDGAPVGPDRMARFSKIILSTWQNTMVSNIGKVAAIDSDPAVEAVSFALCPMPYQTLFNAVSTYKDRLMLNLGYDAGKVAEETATELAAGMRDALHAAAATA
jgi:NRPS condensation-like uncharacterized protein